MEFLCQDLPKYGLVLVPPSSADYQPLLTDIQDRIARTQDSLPPAMVRFMPKVADQERDTSAILLNKSGKTIVGLQLDWLFETDGGRQYRHASIAVTPRTLLLPFEWDEATRKRAVYRQAILAGSKRYLGESGMVGDNSDVRPPDQDEVASATGGGGGTARGAGRSREPDPPRRITLVLDGVFFDSGEFAGPNREKLFEETAAAADAYMAVARVAREGHNRGRSAAEIFSDIEKVTGPTPDRSELVMLNPAFQNPDATPEQFRVAALKQLALRFSRLRAMPQQVRQQGNNDDRIIYTTMAWTDLIVPNLRKI